MALRADLTLRAQLNAIFTDVQEREERREALERRWAEETSPAHTLPRHRERVPHGAPGHQHVRAWSLADLRAFDRASAAADVALAFSDDEGEGSVRVRRRISPGAWTRWEDEW